MADTSKRKPAARGKTKLLASMTGKASTAKTAVGDAPVFAYIASLPKAQRAIAEQIDALAAKAVPGLVRAVKWGWPTTGWKLGGVSRRARLSAT